MSTRARLVVLLLVGGIVLMGWKKQNNSISEKELEVLKKSIVVTGVIAGDQPMVIFSGVEILEKGGIINGAKIISISSEKVEFEKDGKRWIQEVKQWVGH